MKPIITITLQVLVFVALVLALAWALPLWATAGLILLLQIFQLTVIGTTLKLRNDHEQEES